MCVAALPPQEKVHVSTVRRVSINRAAQSCGDGLEVRLTGRVLSNQRKQTLALIHIRHQLNSSGMAFFATRLIVKMQDLD